MVIARCLRCNANRQMKNVTYVRKNGRVRAAGNCKRCGGRVSTFVSTTGKGKKKIKKGPGFDLFRDALDLFS